jgi:hypothetical protein
LSGQPGIIETRFGRDALRYLVRCAFDTGVEAVILRGDERITFRGSVGLAPAWEHRALTGEEERWVSGCLYALINKFGKPVAVSLRGTHPMLDATTLSEDERETFTLHEGGFFGNFFAEQPTAYACRGDGLRAAPEAAAFRDRVCAKVASSLETNGEAVSECGFILAGPCLGKTSANFRGIQYDEVVHVFLRPHR